MIKLPPFMTILKTGPSAQLCGQICLDLPGSAWICLDLETKIWVADVAELLKRALPRHGLYLSPEKFFFNKTEHAGKLTHRATKPANFYYQRPCGDKVTGVSIQACKNPV